MIGRTEIIETEEMITVNIHTSKKVRVIINDKVYTRTYDRDLSDLNRAANIVKYVTVGDTDLGAKSLKQMRAIDGLKSTIGVLYPPVKRNFDGKRFQNPKNYEKETKEEKQFQNTHVSEKRKLFNLKIGRK